MEWKAPIITVGIIAVFLAIYIILQVQTPEVVVSPKAYIPYTLTETPTKGEIKEANLRLQDQRQGLGLFEKATGRMRNLANMTYLMAGLLAWQLLMESRRVFIPHGLGRG